jgi:hypothetical protein
VTVIGSDTLNHEEDVGRRQTSESVMGRRNRDGDRPGGGGGRRNRRMNRRNCRNDDGGRQNDAGSCGVQTFE